MGFETHSVQLKQEAPPLYVVGQFTKRASNVKEVACSEDTTWYIDNNNNKLYGCGSGFCGQQGSGDTESVLTFTEKG